MWRECAQAGRRVNTFERQKTGRTQTPFECALDKTTKFPNLPPRLNDGSDRGNVALKNARQPDGLYNQAASQRPRLIGLGRAGKSCAIGGGNCKPKKSANPG